MQSPHIQYKQAGDLAVTQQLTTPPPRFCIANSCHQLLLPEVDFFREGNRNALGPKPVFNLLRINSLSVKPEPV